MLVTRLKSLATIAAVTVAAVAVPIATASNAHAAGSNWADWSGNCYGWTTWDTNHVTGHTWDHAYDHCQVFIIQWNAYGTPGSGSSVRYGDAYQPGTGADTPTFWHGPSGSGGLLEDQICVQDITTGDNPACSAVYN